MHRTRAPTRVSNACDRCRRQKQRCDDFRPCSNCCHARCGCIDSDPPPLIKKPRISKRADSQDTSAAVDSSHVNRRLAPSVGERHEQPSFRDGPQAPQAPLTDHLAQASSARREPFSGGRHELRHEQSVFADLGGSESAMDITKKILGYATSPSSLDRATFAIPGGDSYRTMGSTSTGNKTLPISNVLGLDLPSREVCDALVDTYFFTVHWFSLVVYEPKFRVRYTTIMDRGVAYPSDRAFLLLLSMVMVMGCWYGSGVLENEMVSAINLDGMRHAFLKAVSQNFMDLIDEDCLEFVQLCALLGSYWLYWGRPKSSFSILGAATKSAQALELHRDLDKRLSSPDAEERKRVWWTIYTWDRFATTIYGRPLGINDKDCNVSMPGSYSEDISFVSRGESARVCLSPYQIQLNRVYQITSPLLENIYGIRFSSDRSLRSQMPGMVSKIEHLMRAWQEELPPHLHLEKHDDISLTSSVEDKMHRLQGLSLQLTYDNLMIVIHRPLLADQSHKRSKRRSTTSQKPTTSDRDPLQCQDMNATNETSFQQCLNSALRISRLQQSKRNLLALARRTHLVSFIGMNLFTSSVVMFICALSDTLSDEAQEAKRGMARNLKMLKLLSGDGSLSMQCSMILEDLVQMIVDKEKEEMLRSLPSDDEMMPFLPTRRNSYNDGHPPVVSAATESHTTLQTSDERGGPHENVNELHSVNDGFSLQQTMASLQRVFKEVATPRSQFAATDYDTDHLQLQDLHQGQAQRLPQSEIRPEHRGFTFDGSNFNTEDLGQFWLWDMDPHIEDGASWQSSNEHS